MSAENIRAKLDEILAMETDDILRDLRTGDIHFSEEMSKDYTASDTANIMLTVYHDGTTDVDKITAIKGFIGDVALRSARESAHGLIKRTFKQWRTSNGMGDE